MSTLLTWLKSFFSKSQNILIFINIALGCYIYYLKNHNNDPAIETANQQIKSIGVKVDSLDKLVKYLTPRLDSTNKAIDTVKTKIHTNDSKLQDIQKSAKKRDSILNTLTPDQLQKYFTDY